MGVTHQFPDFHGQMMNKIADRNDLNRKNLEAVMKAVSNHTFQQDYCDKNRMKKKGQGKLNDCDGLKRPNHNGAQGQRKMVCVEKLLKLVAEQGKPKFRGAALHLLEKPQSQKLARILLASFMARSGRRNEDHDSVTGKKNKKNAEGHTMGTDGDHSMQIYGEVRNQLGVGGDKDDVANVIFLTDGKDSPPSKDADPEKYVVWACHKFAHDADMIRCSKDVKVEKETP